MVVDGGEEYDLRPANATSTSGTGSVETGDEPALIDSGKANQTEVAAYKTGKITYSSVPIVDDNGTYLAAYTPILSKGKVIGLVAAEYDEASSADFQSVVWNAFLWSVVPAIFISLGVAYFLALRYVEPRDMLRTIGESARTQVALALRGEKDHLWESLTPRELEVADLASEGLQNKEIADRLFLSPETVKVHLASITRKTGWTTKQLGLEAQARRIAQLLRGTA